MIMVSFKVGMNRLLRLANILDVADKKHRERKEPTYFQGYYDHPCGTPACALGHWAAHTPSRWKLISMTMNDGNQDFYGLDAAISDFGIDREESHDLFGGNGCDGAKTAKQAAK